MPPEAVKNKDSGKLRDLWSLGCIIYQILTGALGVLVAGSGMRFFCQPFDFAVTPY